MSEDRGIPAGQATEDQETVVDTPELAGGALIGGAVSEPGGRSSWGSLPTGASMSVTSPAEAMRLDELTRFHTLVHVMRWLSVGLLIMLPLFEHGSVLRYVLMGGLALGIPMGWWFDRVIASPGELTQGRMMGVAIGMGFNAFVGIAHFGVFSGATALIVLGLFVLSRTEFRGAAFVVYLSSSVLQAGFAALVIGDVIEDPGLIQVVDPSKRDQIMMQVIIQSVYLFAYLIGSVSRRTTLEAIDKLEGARQEVRQREALLNEARQDLDRALAAGGLGRYSEQTVGSFRLGGVIGRGAMAEVYEAVQVDSGEPAAVKLLHENMLSQPRAVARFLREARAAASVRSPHVARVLAASEPDAPLPYLVMERLYGYDLAQYLREHATMPLDDVIELVRQVGSVIDQAREVGVVHRDLKPQNLFRIEQHGRSVWKVLDFGVSVLAEGSGTLTQGNVVGTPAYISPEQACGEEVDHRADIHALTAIAYRALTGRPPFAGKDMPSLLFSAVHSMPERASSLVPVHEDVDAALAIGLAKRRAERYDSAQQLVDALASAAAGRLDPELRAHARNLIGRLPWGHTEGRAPTRSRRATDRPR